MKALMVALALTLPGVAAAELFDGELMVLEADMADGTSKRFFELETQGGTWRLEGEKTKELPLMSEIQVTVDGTKKFDTIIMSAFTVLTDIDAERSIREDMATTERRAAAIIVNIREKIAPTNPTAWAGLFTRMDTYYNEVSLGQVRFPLDSNKDGKPDVYGPFNIEIANTTCAYSNIASLARHQALAAGMAADYNHEMYVLPQNIGCGWLGLAYLGCRDRCTLWTSSSDNLTVLAHEMGHNLDMHHSGRDTNDDGVLESEYGDHSDVMGNFFDRAVGLSPGHVEQKGWYSAVKPNWLTTYAGGNKEYQVKALASPDDSLQTIKFARAQGGHYYVAYRHAQGVDAGLKAEYAGRVNVYSFAGSGKTRWIKSIGVGESTVVGSVPVKFKSVVGNVATVAMGVVTEPPKPPTDGKRRLVAVHSGKCGTLGTYNRLLQYTCDGEADQLVELVAAGSSVLIKQAGKCLDIGGGSWSNNATVYFTTCHGRQNQLFKFVPQSDGSHVIQTHAGLAGKCLDVYGAYTAEGTRITQWDCSSSANQRFKL